MDLGIRLLFVKYSGMLRARAAAQSSIANFDQFRLNQ